MTVSVIITTRNRATDLRRTCEVVRQLRPAPNEVLVTADGCENLSAAIPTTMEEIEGFMEDKHEARK